MAKQYAYTYKYDTMYCYYGTLSHVYYLPIWQLPRPKYFSNYDAAQSAQHLVRRLKLTAATGTVPVEITEHMQMHCGPRPVPPTPTATTFGTTDRFPSTSCRRHQAGDPK